MWDTEVMTSFSEVVKCMILLNDKSMQCFLFLYLKEKTLKTTTKNNKKANSRQLQQIQLNKQAMKNLDLRTAAVEINCLFY